ncbi:MAG: hypothetical protein IJH76_04305 [Clostridia bacterium]|nr:hypothetical protein [Clostridia bacterium]
MEQKIKVEIYVNDKVSKEHIKKHYLSYKEKQKEGIEKVSNKWEDIGYFLMEFLYDDAQKENTYRKQIIEILEYCVFNEDEELKEITPMQRLSIFIREHQEKDYSILKNNKFSYTLKIPEELPKANLKGLALSMQIDDYNEHNLQQVYEFDNYYNILVFELYQILQGIINIKKCKNCGKYFVTDNSAVTYCSNYFEGQKTCRDIGASKVFIKNVEKDEVYGLYRKIYKRKQALAKNKGGEYQLEYEAFQIIGKQKKDEYKLKEITKKEFMNWLKEQ